MTLETLHPSKLATILMWCLILGALTAQFFDADHEEKTALFINNAREAGRRETKFDRNAYQRDLMRERRAAAKKAALAPSEPEQAVTLR